MYWNQQIIEVLSIIFLPMVLFFFLEMRKGYFIWALELTRTRNKEIAMQAQEGEERREEERESFTYAHVCPLAALTPISVPLQLPCRHLTDYEDDKRMERERQN